MPASPFGKETRIRILKEYFKGAGEATDDNAWQHVYRCLLWINATAGLAHIYDSNHMQPGGGFHTRAVRLTEALCKRFGITQQELGDEIDYLFRGCVAALRAQPHKEEEDEIDEELESELVTQIRAILVGEGLEEARARSAARRVENVSRDFFTVGNKRKNALGEGFEDLLELLLEKAAKVPAERLKLRTPVSKLPGFRRPPPQPPGSKTKREPRPDIAVVADGLTHVITTAKWSMRQDRETQFQAEYSSYQMNKTQSTELQYALVTNEFDTARLNNVAKAMPGGEGGYIFHRIYHINLDLLKETQGTRLGQVAHWIGAGKIQSLADYLRSMRQQFGEN